MPQQFTNAAANGVVASSARRAKRMSVTGAILHNASGGALFFWMEDKATAPSASSTAAKFTPIHVPAGAQVRWEPTQEIDGFAVGISWGWSSSIDSYTEHGTAGDLTTTVFYR